MKLEEAIENTKNRIKSWENIAETGKCCLSNEEYESSQKVCDEENMIIQELERLQKENEELKNIDLTTVYLKAATDEKERWRNKIKELIINKKQQIQENNKQMEECRKTIMEEQELKKLQLFTLNKNNDLLELEIVDLLALLKEE